MALSLTALGIVFGDIGTSPIYALRESFHAKLSSYTRRAKWRGGGSGSSAARLGTLFSPRHYFGIPPNRVVELGMQVQL